MEQQQNHLEAMFSYLQLALCMHPMRNQSLLLKMLVSHQSK